MVQRPLHDDHSRTYHRQDYILTAPQGHAQNQVPIFQLLRVVLPIAHGATTSILSRNTQLLRELITDARELYKAASKHFINVYAAET